MCNCNFQLYWCSWHQEHRYQSLQHIHQCLQQQSSIYAACNGQYTFTITAKHVLVQQVTIAAIAHEAPNGVNTPLLAVASIGLALINI